MLNVTDNLEPRSTTVRGRLNQRGHKRHGGLAGEVVRPSALGSSELTTWRRFVAEDTVFHRPFFTPEFALACEGAGEYAYVAVLHRAGTIEGFFPFQFRSACHRAARLAERIGGNISDAAGLIGRSELRIDSETLLRLCGLGVLHATHLMEGQERYGLDASWSDTSYLTDLSEGPAGYFAELLQRNSHLFRDTERRLRKATSAYGALRLVELQNVSEEDLVRLVEEKRQQYHRTGVEDPFDSGAYMRLLNFVRENPSPDCRLTLTRLEGDDRVLAQHVGLRYRGILGWWFPVYDRDAQNLSPGRLLLWKIIEAAASLGIELIDYGAGDAQFKRHLSNGSLRIGTANWTSGTIRSAVARAWQSAEWRLASWRRPGPRTVDATG